MSHAVTISSTVSSTSKLSVIIPENSIIVFPASLILISLVRSYPSALFSTFGDSTHTPTFYLTH